MPAKSKAQLRFLFSKGAKKKGITEEQVREWARSTPNISKLPERVGKKSKKK